MHKSVPSRAFFATLQSSIPVFTLPFFLTPTPAQGKVQLMSKALNIHTHCDFSVTRPLLIYLFIFIFHFEYEQQTQAAFIPFFHIQRECSFISTDNYLDLFSCVQVNCLHKSSTLDWQLGSCAVFSDLLGLSPAVLGYLKALIGQMAVENREKGIQPLLPPKQRGVFCSSVGTKHLSLKRAVCLSYISEIWLFPKRK